MKSFKLIFQTPYGQAAIRVFADNVESARVMAEAMNVSLQNPELPFGTQIDFLMIDEE